LKPCIFYAHRDDLEGPVIISGRRYTCTDVEISHRNHVKSVAEYPELRLE
jgi:hypothetical protein